MFGGTHSPGEHISLTSAKILVLGTKIPGKFGPPDYYQMSVRASRGIRIIRAKILRCKHFLMTQVWSKCLYSIIKPEEIV